MSYQSTKKTTGAPRDHRLGLFFTAAEWNALEQIAKAEGNDTVHDWVLATALASAEVAASEHRIAWPRGERS